MQLQRFRSYPHGCIRSEHLGHGRFLCILAMIRLEFRCLIDQVTRSLNTCSHIRNLKAYALVCRNRLSELDTFTCVIDGCFKSALRNTQRLGSNTNTAAIQRCHSNLKAFAFFAQQVFLRNDDVLEFQFRRQR